MKQPDIKLNPHPKMRYEVTLTIEDAPGSFDAVEGFASYEVTNSNCIPLTPFSGAKLTPKKNVPITLIRLSEKIYKGEIYVDLLEDDDYFDLGLCRWSMTFANFGLSVGNLLFGHSIAVKEALGGKAVSRYFTKRSYVSEDAKSTKGPHQRLSIGNKDRSDFGDDSTNTFSMTLSAKEKLQ